MLASIAVENLGAQHRAIEIDQRKNDWLLAEELAEFDGVAVLVVKGEIERDLLIQLLVDADVFQEIGADADALHRVGELGARGLRREGECPGQGCYASCDADSAEFSEA